MNKILHLCYSLLDSFSNIMITKYGLNTFLINVGFSLALIFSTIFIQEKWITYLLICFGILFLFFNINFFRNPKRITPDKKNVIFSSADGKVVSIKEVFEKKFINGEAVQISVFMSPFDAHVNRIPIDGTVTYLNYVKGDYFVAFHDKADLRNERTEIGIESRYGKILFTQVAGFVARRIVYNLKLNDKVKAGEEFGMIKFGSRSDIIAPKGCNVKVKLGDKVLAGETILFERGHE